MYMVDQSEAWTRAKIDSLFFHWISSTEGSDTVRQLVRDCEAGKLVQQQQQDSQQSAPPPPMNTSSTPSPSSTTPKKLSISSAAASAEESTPPTPTNKKSVLKKTSTPAALTPPPINSPTNTMAYSHSNHELLNLPSKKPTPISLSLDYRQDEIDSIFAQFDGRVNVESFAMLCQQVLKLSFCLVVPLFRRIRVLLVMWGRHAPDPRLEELEMKIAQEVREHEANKLPRNPAWMSESQAEMLTELEHGTISREDFCYFWQQEIEPYPSHEERMFRLIKQPQAATILPKDFFPILKELIDTHPGLEFLETAPEFQEKYARTVVARIFQRVNLTWSGKITLREWLRSDFPAFLDLVSTEDEINSVNEYFSYEHFYVIYCKFWELDSNHDFSLTKDEFSRFANHSLTRIIVDRIFAQVCRPFTSGLNNRMGYEDFCFFLLCEEDKTTEASLRYWFDLVDLNLDGHLSPWEIRVFYEEQLKRMCHFQPEDDMATFEDLCCQIKDSLCPSTDEWTITVREFLREKQTSGVFLNQLFNLGKFLNYETRDPFAALKMQAEGIEVPVMTDWDRFALQEYAKLAGAEEARNTANAITPEIVAQLVEEMEDSIMLQQQQSEDSLRLVTQELIVTPVNNKRATPLFAIENDAMLRLACANVMSLFQ